MTAWPGDFSRTPLMRAWPATTSAAALVRAFTTAHVTAIYRDAGVPSDPTSRTDRRRATAFSSDVGTGSRRTNASKKKLQPGSDPNHNRTDLSADPCGCRQLLLERRRLANGELGSTGRSRSRGVALAAYCRCDGPPSGRWSRRLCRGHPCRAQFCRGRRRIAVVAVALPSLAFKRDSAGDPDRPAARSPLAPSAPGGAASTGASGRDLRNGCCGAAGRARGARVFHPRRPHPPRRRRCTVLGTVRMALMAVAAAVMARPAVVGSSTGPPDLEHFWSRCGGVSRFCCRRGDVSVAASMAAGSGWPHRLRPQEKPPQVSRRFNFSQKPQLAGRFPARPMRARAWPARRRYRAARPRSARHQHRRRAAQHW